MAALLLAGLAHATAATESPARYVGPFIGTDGTGHVFPGASVPWGMVAPGPDQADTGWDYTSGYQYRTPTILGFSNTHISGAGIPELGDVLLMPRQGQAWHAGSARFAAHKARHSEVAEPGEFVRESGGDGFLLRGRQSPGVPGGHARALR